ncbi:hypothetical protein [Georgenia faecalis]|uniref:ATP/GTP-binding protein n=1 Tax=Georgenia faecalis TaxID=2483799 RepID=A0ABV9DD61_9MICO|nr:hypothetical protein [Georgenia faecalis]
MPSSRRSQRRPYSQGHTPLDPDRLRGIARTEHGPGGEEYVVRQVRGSEKAYRCPGCDQLVPPGVSHVVAWPSDHLLGAQAALADRRHWHTSCWSGRRRPTR